MCEFKRINKGGPEPVLLLPSPPPTCTPRRFSFYPFFCTKLSSWCNNYYTTVHGSLILVHVPEGQPPRSPALCLSPREIFRIEIRRGLPVGEHVVEHARVLDVLDLLGVICVRVSRDGNETLGWRGGVRRSGGKSEAEESPE